MIELSVVIPIRNEAQSLDELCREMTAALEPWGRPYEILVIDDGSTDDSFAILSRLQAADPRWRIIRFRRNFGQTAAFSAGFAHARGRVIVTSDGDLQNDPRDIPGMVERVVYVGSTLQAIVHLAPGQTLQAWMQNEGDGIPFEQGTPISVHFPTDALRVLLDTGSLEELHRMEEPLAAT